MTLAVIIGCMLARAAGAQAVDVVRGRITSTDSRPIVDATIVVTSAAGGPTRTARTDADGRFMLTYPASDDHLVVTVSAIGFSQKRLELRHTPDETVLIADTRLARIAELAPVRVNALREKVDRSAPRTDIGGTDRAPRAQNLASDQLGDLAALAASLPGVQLITNPDGSSRGFSVLGLSEDQNRATLNGLGFAATSLPRDAAVAVSVATSPYDVSRGGFSGGQLTLTTRLPLVYPLRAFTAHMDTPSAQWADPATTALGRRYDRISVGGVATGVAVAERLYYNVSFQGGRRWNDLRTLVNTNDAGLAAFGASPDSVRRFLDILERLGVPASVQPFAHTHATDQALVFASFDLMQSPSDQGQTINVVVNGSWNSEAPTGLSTTAVPAVGGTRDGWNGSIAARQNMYVGFGLLSETSAGVQASGTRCYPIANIPAGSVRVPSGTASAASALSVFGFGGSAACRTNDATSTAEVTSHLSWFSANNRHRLQAGVELRRETFDRTSAANSLGTFAFASLADLEGSRPASFTRALSGRAIDGGVLIGGLSLGDVYRASPSFRIEYGLRLDLASALSQPALNPALRDALGVRNDVIPATRMVSPRAGFLWSPGAAGASITSFSPQPTLRGGIGVFQNLPGAAAAAAPLGFTGLADAEGRLTCLGDAAPAPEWRTLRLDPGTVPAKCKDGSNGVFVAGAPDVYVYAQGFAFPHSVRSNLQWSSALWTGGPLVAAELIYSRNLSQSGTVDLNFAGNARFSLAEERGRPVFVSPAAIVPGTGLPAFTDAVRSQAFGHVTAIASYFASESRQLSLRLTPGALSYRINWTFAWVYSDVRERASGFGSTGGDPRESGWSRSLFSPRHQFVYSIAYNVADWARIDWLGSVRSGAPFAPMVGTDVNGDGYSNDRAFVFDPATTSDGGVASGMGQLLRDAPSWARACLRRQLGRVADRASCETPWTTAAVASLTINPVKARLPRRATLSLQLSNPLGALDQLLHSATHVRGWGQPIVPDGTLLNVTGFDAARQRYSYAVNPRFGTTSPALGTSRIPVVLTAIVRLDAAPVRERVTLAQTIATGRRVTDADRGLGAYRTIFTTAGLPNPMELILRQADSLRLTQAQADRLTAINIAYKGRVDAAWSETATWLAALPTQRPEAEVFARYLGDRNKAVDALTGLLPELRATLDVQQRRRLSPVVSRMLDEQFLASIRNGTIGGLFDGPLTLPGGGAPSVAGSAGALRASRP